MTSDATAPERNPFLEAVGRVTVAGAQLDASLHHLLGAIAHEPTLIMYANAASTDQLLQFCRLALTVGTIEPEDVTEIEACLKRADSLRIRRNTVVHSIYMTAESGEGFDAMKPVRKSLGYSVTPITVEEMETLADEVAVLRSDMFTAGWNATAAKLPGMGRVGPRAPGDTVYGVRTDG
ncbi:hypothetical protein ACFVYV_43465 [Streptomyces mirabilis]|uniref:hypothetical protein n=1 Tax=Streptomyces mirabilis TaxID=68239 RepID=UPI0036DC7AE8